MTRYDLCLASNWEYDAGFIRLLDAACAARGRTLWTVTPHNLAHSLSHLATGAAGFRVLLDRASESDAAFLPLVEAARGLRARRLNPRELADRAYDKVAMHHALRTAGIPTPHTLILPSFDEQPRLTALDLSPFDGCAVVKPAFGGGGEGVMTEVSTLEQVSSARRHFPNQSYLIQAHVTPKRLDGRPAWFRVIYCLGEVYLSFWDTGTHVYTHVPAGQEHHLGVGSLHEVTRRIAGLCQLELFSTEIALTASNQPVVVDYVNDPIDLRLQSEAIDGVPDVIVSSIAARLAAAAGAPPGPYLYSPE